MPPVSPSYLRAYLDNGLWGEDQLWDGVARNAFTVFVCLYVLPEEAEEKLQPFGIKVFVISGYDTADFGNQVTNIGKMFNTEDKAQKFLDFFTEPLDYIQEKLGFKDGAEEYFNKLGESIADKHTKIPQDVFFLCKLFEE